MSSAADHCRDLVRDSARDRYLASLFAPDEKRRQLFALYALDIEIARIATAVSEPQIGLIRQQWWLAHFRGVKCSLNRGQKRLPVHRLTNRPRREPPRRRRSANCMVPVKRVLAR